MTTHYAAIALVGLLGGLGTTAQASTLPDFTPPRAVLLTDDDATPEAGSSPADELGPLLIFGRVSVSYLLSDEQAVQAASLGFNRQLRYRYDNKRHLLGGRLVYIPVPPSRTMVNPFDDITHALGLAMDGTILGDTRGPVTPYTTLSIGAVASPRREIVLPLADLGMGMRIALGAPARPTRVLALELGWVPGAGAPYVAVNLGKLIHTQ